MLRASRLAHVIGLVMTLGSISTFLVVSAVIDGGGVESIALGRRIISAGTSALTIPGMCVLGASGIWVGLRLHGAKARFFQIKLLLLALIAANGAIFVAPWVSAATSSVGQCSPSPSAFFRKASRARGELNSPAQSGQSHSSRARGSLLGPRRTVKLFRYQIQAQLGLTVIPHFSHRRRFIPEH